MNDLVANLFEKLESARTVEQLLQSPLEDWMKCIDLQAVTLMSGSHGAWKKVLQLGLGAPEPPDWNTASDVLDSREIRHRSVWTYYPLDCESAREFVLCFHPRIEMLTHGSKAAQGESSAEDSPNRSLSLERQIRTIGKAIDVWHRQHQRSRDIIRLTQILTVAADWHTHQDLDRLLQDIAQAATRLLRSDRASIFLWDKGTRELVGHPALGIEGKPLRIADDKGVAGLVMKTQEPRRWDRSDPLDEVDRRVDTSSGYRTDSLIAVPLVDQKGKPMGVFEVINHADGKFDAQDEADLVELAKHASAALANTQQLQRLVQLRDRMTKDAIEQVQLIGHSQEIVDLKSTIAKVGDTDLAVLLLGENGTGKEVVSRQIHYQSKRRFEPFIAVNCAAITETLLESELFGHEKGAFTDALETRTGKFELASGGTLFLDEIGDMSLAGQAKLLRVLEEKVVVRVGGSATIPVNVRVVAATNQNLVELVQKKKFREDLYFRLTVVTIHLPPLRQRGRDILELAEFFLVMFCQKIGRSKPTWTEGARKRLVAHHWPGNVRELRNIVERVAYLSTNDTIVESDIDFVKSPRQGDDEKGNLVDLTKTLSEATADFQVKYIEEQIKASHRNVSQAAEKMGLQRSNLYRKMKQLGMNQEE